MRKTDQQQDTGCDPDEIIEDLRHQDLLGYAAPDSPGNGDLLRIRVEVPGHGFGVRVRQSYRRTPHKPQ